jgi:hypothetical protein
MLQSVRPATQCGGGLDGGGGGRGLAGGGNPGFGEQVRGLAEGKSGGWRGEGNRREVVGMRESRGGWGVMGMRGSRGRGWDEGESGGGGAW